VIVETACAFGSFPELGDAIQLCNTIGCAWSAELHFRNHKAYVCF
jgi:hypothetical protein